MVRPDDGAPRNIGRYVLFGELASGGMATVHFGRLSGPVGFTRTVAIKRLHPQFAKDPEFVTMFLDEARLCGRIRHPNVVPTLDVVTVAGEIFIVMEYVPGEALSKLLRTAWRTNVPMPPRVAASILSSVLHGLHAAHQTKDEHGRELGIVHRDVSPQNILVGGDGIARVLDFGVAKARGRLQTTRDGQVKGKIAYMPPEQLAGAGVSRQTDIYAGGVVLWEALAGRRLFEAETEALVLARVIENHVDPPSRYNPTINPAIDALVMRGLARDPAQRFATAREMAVAIEQTIGLASPSEVGEWVESVAGDELARRASAIAAIEAASLESGGMSSRSLRSSRPAASGDVPSQVSSISVSRPMSAPPPTRSNGAKWFVAAAATLAAVGAVLAVVALRDMREATARAEVKHVVHEPRTLALTAPTAVTSRVGATVAPAEPRAVPTAQPRAAQAPPPRPIAPPAPPNESKPAVNCEPPYTVDAAGHKKYKRECI